MKKIRMLRVSFDAEIKDSEVPAFRAAIIDKVGQKNVLFHHHLDQEKFLYRYPLIQYKVLQHQPTIICIDYGVDEIHKYFEKRNWNIRVNDRQLEMKISRLELNQFNLQVWNKHFEYSIHNWIALNQENLEKYNNLTALSDRIAFLEKTLTGNIISFAKGVEWTVDKQIELKILDFKEPRTVKLKTNDLIGFNVNFSTNVFLPNFIGLGKAVSKGYGIVRSVRQDLQD
ncbi:MAG: CRISPR-associated endonuclease Cas6 [Bacteroidetes bacterium]|nr:CRISPR-associated endonuclease Cas6 [Bacteroidota bacterium]